MDESQPKATRAALIASLYALAIGCGAVVAFWHIFSRFQAYDDEGYVMLSVASYLDGHKLYDEVYTQYGPCFYLYKAVVHKLSGWAVMHDSVRLTTIAAWLVSSVMCSMFAYRTTRSLLLASATYLLVFKSLGALTNEPGHPQELCAMLLSGCLLTSTFVSQQMLKPVVTILGSLVAALCLTKINVGVYLLLSLCSFAVAYSSNGRTRNVTAGALLLITVALPALLMRTHLDTSWAQNFAVVAATSCAAAFAVAIGNSMPRVISVGMLAAAGTSFALTVILICAIPLVGGTTPLGLWQGVVTQHLKFGSVFCIPARMPSLALATAIGSAVTALGYYLSKLGIVRFPANVLAALPVLSGLSRATLVAVVVWSVMRGQAHVLLAFVTPWLWLALINPKAAEPQELPDVFSRAVAVLVATWQVLQAYPVAGSQEYLGSFLFVPTAAICACDLWGQLQQVEFRAGSRLRRTGLALAYFAIMISWLRMGREHRKHYLLQVPLGLPGAELVHLPEADANIYRDLAAKLNEHSDTFFSLPGMNSLYFWSDRRPPTALNATLWMTLLDDAQQERIIAELDRHPRACLVRNRELIDFWLRGQDVQQKPLVRYLNEQFVEATRIGSYELLTRPGRTDTALFINPNHGGRSRGR